jgi:hypothetical protein
MLRRNRITFALLHGNHITFALLHGVERATELGRCSERVRSCRGFRDPTTVRWRSTAAADAYAAEADAADADAADDTADANAADDTNATDDAAAAAFSSCTASYGASSDRLLDFT